MTQHDSRAAAAAIVGAQLARDKRNELTGKRLYILFHQALHSIAHGLRWSRWRRRHQARARWYHHRARLRDLETYS